MRGKVYHILNRGFEKRNVFLNVEHFMRFVHNLLDFNTTKSAEDSYYVRRKTSEVGPLKTNKLVDVLCWTILPNHPHILVAEKEDGFASAFSRKIFGGFTMYFNEQKEVVCCFKVGQK